MESLAGDRLADFHAQDNAQVIIGETEALSGARGDAGRDVEREAARPVRIP